MTQGIKPEHQRNYLLQADEMLDDIKGASVEVRVKRVVTEYCHQPDLAQFEIDGLIELLPRIENCPPLDSIYALRTLVRTRTSVAELLFNIDDARIASLLGKRSDPDGRDGHWEDSVGFDEVYGAPSVALWGDRHTAEDILQGEHRKKRIEDSLTCTMNERMLKLEDANGPEECFGLATRRLSIALLDACSDQKSMSQLLAATPAEFRRMNPLISAGLASRDHIVAVACGLITDINALPGSDKIFVDEAA